MAEYINRASLINHLNTFAPEHYNSLVNDLILKEPAADVIERKKGEWIPVTERLPKDGVPVQACYVGYHSRRLRSDLLACRHEDTWCYWHGEPCSYNKCKVIITHWMPLPEPPKEET